MSVQQTTAFADGRLILTAGRIARIAINAPERKNALTAAMWAALPGICARISADEGIRVVVLAASGGRAFSAGADIGEFAEVYATPEAAARYNAAVRAAQAALRSLDRPVIAEVGGACVGGGCGLALSCDLRFAGASARFGITPARLGIAYSWDDTAALVEKVGPGRAKDLLFSARLIGADEALRIGLVERVTPDAELSAAVLAYAGELAELSPASIRAAKAIVNRIAETDPQGREAVRAIWEAGFSGEDFREGRAAFLEARAPKF
ncbi:MAG: enoyl-CoA hydratase-related protein [Paracoccaceae bacterium]